MPAPSFTPRLMKLPMAAHYLGVSATKLRDLPIKRKKDGGNVLYDVNDLDDYADRLPYEDREAVNSCDDL